MALLFCLPAQPAMAAEALAQPPGALPAGPSCQLGEPGCAVPSAELLDFLGTFATDDPNWQDPMDLPAARSCSMDKSHAAPDS